ncbi:MAG: NnrU family protein [Paracoccaceae bacterium]
MVWLILGVLLWSYSHLMKRVTPGFRAGLGDNTGKLVVTVLTFAALALMITSYRGAEVITLWEPPAFLRPLSILLMLVAVVLVTLGYSRGALRSRLRHPMLTSVKVWALAHLLVNGDLASVVLFGGLLAWAVLDVILINRMEPAWQRPQPGPVRNDALHIAMSAVLFAGIGWLHGWLGVPVLGG